MQKLKLLKLNTNYYIPTSGARDGRCPDIVSVINKWRGLKNFILSAEGRINMGKIAGVGQGTDN